MKNLRGWWPLAGVASGVLCGVIAIAVYVMAMNPKLRGCLPLVGAPGDCGRITEIVEASQALNWIRRDDGTRRAALFGVTYANQQFVAVGEHGLIATSPDGVTWRTSSVQTRGRLRSVAFGEGIWVAVSDQGTILTSSNTVTWTAHDLPGQPSFRAVAYGNGRFVVVGLGGNYASEDASTWVRASDGYTLGGVIWDGERFRAVGTNWIVAASSHGLGYGRQPVDTWLFRPEYTMSDHDFRSIARGPHRYVVVGGDGTSGNILVSEDGQSWRRHLWVRQMMRRVIYADGQFVAVGDHWLLTSRDGFDWTAHQVPGDPVYDVAWGNGRYVLVGSSGQIYLSE